MIGWAVVAIAKDPTAVVQSLTDEVTIDWTNLEVEVQATAQAPAVGSLRAIEELARQNIAKTLQRALPRVPLTATIALGAIQTDPVLDAPIAARQARWQVTEAQYATSGTVRLTASLSLASVVKPWVLANALPEATSAVDPPFTGVLVDARAVDVSMAVAPRIVTEDGEVLFDGRLDAFSAVTRAPVRYVASPAHRRADQAGERPWRLLATAVQSEVDLIVAEVDPAERASALQVLQSGEIIIVVRDGR
ncbi:MAG: hypothetical protein AAGA48_32250 [Myxococcota bacterium]